MSAEGVAIPLNPECETYFRLGLDDQLKFRHNRKTYQQLICEALALPYERRRYRLYPDARARSAAEQVWRAAGVSPDETVIALNTGAGAVFANKNWPPPRYIELARRLAATPGRRVALLGGPAEAQRNRVIAQSCPSAVDTGSDHDEPTFAALVSRCDVVVTGDTMAMHVAIAFGVPCVALFGPTCSQEIDFYGRGEAVVTELRCAPCYRRSCDVQPSCMDDIGVDRVAEAVERWVDRRRVEGGGCRSLPVVGAAS
ncbi:MAG: glycosyltransferase family 9 protein [Planctomycetota bacterium]|nr:MAG: glycosyltransferase family 9 protein [Planctomycetota bacterium]